MDEWISLESLEKETQEVIQWIKSLEGIDNASEWLSEIEEGLISPLVILYKKRSHFIVIQKSLWQKKNIL